MKLNVHFRVSSLKRPILIELLVCVCVCVCQEHKIVFTDTLFDSLHFHNGEYLFICLLSHF